MPFFEVFGLNPIFRQDRENRNFLSYEEYENDSSIFCFHSQLELYFIDDGEMDITVNSYRKRLEKGEMSVALSFDAHAYATVEESRSSAFFIPSYMCPEFIETFKNKRAASPFITDKNVVKKIKALVSELLQAKDNAILCQGYIYVILGIISENISFERKNEDANPDLSAKLLSYINENFSEEISLSSLSRKLGYNESYISKYFKECFHIGINRYLSTVRLKNALMLMYEKKYTTAYCALESGFSSLRTFYRAFQKEFGCTPKEYMRNVTDATDLSRDLI